MGCNAEGSQCPWITIGLVVAWWGSAVAVTVLMKASMTKSDNSFGLMWFPFPLTITLFSNLCTAALIELVAFSRDVCLKVREAKCANRTPNVSVNVDPFQTPSLQDSSTTSPLLTPSTQAPSTPPSRAETPSTPPKRVKKPFVKSPAPMPPPAWRPQPKWPRRDFSVLCMMGVMQGLALGAKNEALLMLNVSTRTMIMATNVLMTMLIAWTFNVESFGKRKLCAASLVAIGGILQGYAHMESASTSTTKRDHPFGYVLAMISLILDASRWIMLQALFKKKEEEKCCLGYVPPSMGSPSTDPRAAAIIDEKKRVELEQAADADATRDAIRKLRMVSAVMWSSAPIILFLSLVFEPGTIGEALNNIEDLAKFMSMLALGVLGINVCEFGVVRYTSAVTFTVLSNLHSLPLVFSGIIFFGDVVKPLQMAGFVVCVLGSLLYSKAKVVEAAETLPK